MSIRSIDMMILYSKTADVEKMQQQQQQQPTVAQQQITEEAVHKKEIEKAQVTKTPQGEGGKVERKKDQEGGRGGRQPGQDLAQDDESQQKKKKFGPHTGRSIDIRI